MEHLAFFQLPRDPFRNDPELDWYFEGTPQKAARRRLVRCIQQGKGLALLSGTGGVGKTMLARAFFEALDSERYEAAFSVIARGAEVTWLRQSVAQQFGVEDPSEDRAEGMRELFLQLVALRETERSPVLFIDEAQVLSAAAMAELRSWMNLELEERKLLSLVLIGTPDLEEVLRANRSLWARVEARVKLGAFPEEEGPTYLAHRLENAGGRAEILSPGAAAAIAEAAAGIPRYLNTMADAALFEAHLVGHSTVTQEDVERAARDLPWAKGSSPAYHAESERAFSRGAAEPRPRRGGTARKERASAAVRGAAVAQGTISGGDERSSAEGQCSPVGGTMRRDPAERGFVGQDPAAVRGGPERSAYEHEGAQLGAGTRPTRAEVLGYTRADAALEALEAAGTEYASFESHRRGGVVADTELDADRLSPAEPVEIPPADPRSLEVETPPDSPQSPHVSDTAAESPDDEIEGLIIGLADRN